MIDLEDSEAVGVRRAVKSEAAFRTISEVSEDLEVPQHVLRFWESKFPQIKPLKRGGGRRYYRPEDISLLRHIRDLLYKDGYTIRGVQKLLKEQGRPDLKRVAQAPAPAEIAPESDELELEPEPDELELEPEPAVPALCEEPIADEPEPLPEEPAPLAMETMAQNRFPPEDRAELSGLLAELFDLREILTRARNFSRES